MASFVAIALAGGAWTSVGCAERHVSTTATATERQDVELGRIGAAVERALVADPPRGYAAVPKGVRLLSVARDDGRAIVLDFTGELLAGGTGRVLEDALHQIVAAASAARVAAAREGDNATPGRVDDYRVLINGVSLDSYLR